MEFLAPILYGIIQGLTEFFPVSSSGHLAILPGILNMKDPGIFFDLTMHIGTALAVTIYYHKKILLILKDFFNFITFKKDKLSDDYQFMMNMVMSTISSVGLILILMKTGYSEAFRLPQYIAFNLIFFGFLLFLSEIIQKKKKPVLEKKYFTKSFRLKESLVVGLSQALAIFPGVSRSGITLTACMFMGIKKEESINYSFLLSLPLIFGGFFVKLLELKSNEVSFDLYSVSMGLIFSFGIGILSIHYFLKLMKHFGLFSFLIYRIILGSAILYSLH